VDVVGRGIRQAVPCPALPLVTLAVFSRPTDAANLPDRLADIVPAGARRFGSPSNRISYRVGATSVTVSASDDNTAVTVRHTTGC
jgi:hypothetical protein